MVAKDFTTTRSSTAEHRVQTALKRLVDLAVVIPVLTLLSPVFALIALLIKLDSTGPAFHTGPRLGRRGKPFSCVKFRTMYIDSDQLLRDYLERNPEAKREWEVYKKLTN